MRIIAARKRPAAVLLAAATLWLIPEAWAQSALKSRRDVGVGDHPIGAIAADVDGDGFVDLISVNQITNNVGDIHFLKGFGDGTFRKVRTIGAGSRPSGAVLGHADADGFLDFIASNLLSQDVTVSLGDGTGNFGAPLSTRVFGSAVGLATGDWNGDGRLDVATINGLQNSVSTLLGDGAGRFTNLRQFTVGTSPKQIVAADYNRDTRVDLAVVNNVSNSIQIWRGDGAGVFSLAQTLATGSSPTGMVAADFNADTRLDIAVSNFNADTVSIFLGNTQGNFAAPTTLATGFGPRAVAVAQMNADAFVDLLVTQSRVPGVGELAVLNGNGNGTFGPPAISKTGPVPTSAVAADFNRDGTQDVAVVSVTGNMISILQNMGGGAFLVANRVNLASGSFPHGVAVADFNRDGRQDIAAANEAANNISVCVGDGLGGCTSINSANNTGITPFALVAADFNRDLCPDIISANNGDGTMSYLLNNCAANFTVTTSPTGCESPVALARGEISGDLNLDVVFVCETPPVDSPMCTRRGTAAAGTAAFGAPVCSAVTDNPDGVAVGPYTIDALEDAAVTSVAFDGVAIAVADGSGGITDVPALFAVGDEPKGIVRDDVTGDGFLDLIVANSGTNTISTLIGDGGGIFSVPAFESLVGVAPTGVAIADFNLDGKKDAAVVNTNSNNVSLLLGDGTGRFTHAGFYGTRDVPIGIGAGDFNGDGKPDLAVADNFNDSITILLNQSAIGDPLGGAYTIGGARLVFVWGIVPGATYDVIRGRARAVAQGPTSFNLGPVDCLANDLIETDTAAFPDATTPPLGDAYFYAVRSTSAGVAGQYTVSVPAGKPGIPGSGGCP